MISSVLRLLVFLDIHSVEERKILNKNKITVVPKIIYDKHNLYFMGESKIINVI